ncbi:hypothetical protein MHLP_03560 [Candidatus Mycoplasma haematolamae str. Purdue]|uniref:Uncharacterized protein n=1 Tax=Mycoplasma haematolamae (strain Purdue) TaxID=1212765 RepID=I7C6W6_MYCHA|nr:hypothetical protein MHLP_03560 [Candidatus Mycoplasma haematolamae str. Purdue]
MRALRGKEFSTVCLKDDLKRKYFSDECDKEIKTEGGAKARVVDVLKSAYDRNGNSYSLFTSSDWKIATKGRGGWSNQPKVENYSDLSYKGYSKGLVAEQCPQLKSLWGFIQGIADV